ncbi:hypothetical protein LTR56_011291 [Elasticomyces elasticus]|nr:hypothetical protein LTR56_011291 [Elasticomyces elasticus]KAK3668364.1 hypothetical protein LTR22_000655 [Elasticomyces elasticus]KAK4930946.1 hypothetical protein LTR49_002713 [Elasticomyces elasticus]KAK5758642.1 hypothetical protein LTS12_011187 [Elasticomyces elasticus]
MRFPTLAALALLTLTTLAWDMFVNITPGHRSLSPTFYTRSSVKASTTFTTSTVTMEMSVSLSTDIDMQAQCTATGSASSCMAQYPEMPQPTDTDTSTADMAKGIEHLLWFIAIGGALLLLCTGRVEAVGLLLLLIIARVNSEALPVEPTSLELSTTGFESATTLGSMTLAIDPPNTILALDQKLQCWQTMNGLSFPSPCPSVNLWTQGPSGPDPTATPGPVCYAPDGLVVPCAGIGHSAASSAFVLANLTSRMISMRACMVAVVFAGRVWARPMAALCLAIVVNAEGISHTTTMEYSTSSIDYAPTTTPLPNTTFVGKVLLCYSTANGLMYPEQCPTDLDLPPPNLEPGDCLQDGVVVHCGAGIRSAASITTMASLGSVLKGLWLPFVAYAVGVIDGKTMMWVWLGTVLNVHVLASPQQVVSGPAVTSTITVYEASRVGITATATALHAFTARDDPAICAATADSVFLVRDVQRLANATMATVLRAAETCSSLYGMPNCPLSTTGPIASSAGHSGPLPLDRPILGLALPLLINGRLLYAFWGLIAAAHVHAQIPGASGLTSAHDPGAPIVGGLTSVPLPQLAVNITTTPAVTVTQTMFVAGLNVQFTPTITEYIAVCTPYCAHMNKEGTCDKIQGCEGVVTSGSGSGKIVLAAYVCALAGLVSFVFAWGMTVGRMGLWMEL